ncbi:MAG: hypothetical protein LWY06_10250 [Firmicutes bacterium]|nr:hypothetical protein [Bacillota bacterium]
MFDDRVESESAAGWVKPVSDYRKPDYPAKSECRGENTASGLCMAKKYLINTGLAAALFLGGNFLSAAPEASASDCCNKTNSRIVSEANCGIPDSASPLQRLLAFDSAKTGVKTAPLFEYGAGYASTGGVAYIEPIFIREADARKIIEDQFRKSGIKFDSFNKTVDDLKIRQKQAGLSNAGKVVVSDIPGGGSYTPVLDGFNKEKNLGYIYMSVEKYRKFIPNSNCGTLDVWALKDAASSLRAEMEKYGKINVIVFYDPLYKPSRTAIKTQEQMKMSVEMLKKQVSDGIKWIKANNL